MPASGYCIPRPDCDELHRGPSMFAYRSVPLLGRGEVDLPAGIPEPLCPEDVKPLPTIDPETRPFQELVKECGAAMDNEDDGDNVFEVGGEG